MFRFKIKIQNEHSLKIRDNSEHRFSIKSMMATIIIYVGGAIKYSSKTAIQKAVLLARAFIKNSYKSSTALLGKVMVRLVGVGTLYKSSTKALERFLVKTSSALKMSHRTSVIERFLVRFGVKEIKSSMTTFVNKAVILARTFLNNSYKSSTSLLGKAMVRLVGIGTVYKSTSKALERFLIRTSSILKMSHETSVLDRFFVRFTTKESKYSMNTLVNKVVTLARTFLNNSYKSTTSAIGRVFVRLRGDTLYKSSSDAQERFLVKLSPILGEEIELNEYVGKKLKDLHKNLKHLCYVISDFYHSFTTSMYEKIMVALKIEAIRYSAYSKNTSNKMLSRMRGILTFSSSTLANAKAWIRAKGELLFSHQTSVSESGGTRATALSNLYKMVMSVKDTLFIKINSHNSSSSSTKMHKEGMSGRIVGEAIKYIGSTTSSSVNKILTKLRGENSISSKTEVAETKMYEYYTVRLKDYENKQLNESPKSLLRFCYIVDKNWNAVKKVYKLWSSVKERVSNWGDLK